MLGLPVDIALDLHFIKADGRREISDAPDAVLLEIDIANELEFAAETEAGISFQFLDGIGYGNIGRDFKLNMYVVLASVSVPQM
jgi:hypothetical protein